MLAFKGLFELLQLQLLEDQMLQLPEVDCGKFAHLVFLVQKFLEYDGPLRSAEFNLDGNGKGGEGSDELNGEKVRVLRDFYFHLVLKVGIKAGEETIEVCEMLFQVYCVLIIIMQVEFRY